MGSVSSQVLIKGRQEGQRQRRRCEARQQKPIALEAVTGEGGRRH